MIAMIKDGKTVNVPDAHIPAYERMGYSPVDATYIPVPVKTSDQRIRELEAENADLKEAHANAVQEFSQAMAANESCAATIRELEAANAKLTEENAALKAELEEYKAQVFQDLAPAGSGAATKPKSTKGKKTADET